VQIEHGDNLNDPSQPENVEAFPSRWRLTGRVEPVDAAEVLSPHVIDGPRLLGNRGAAMPENVAMRGVEASLALVRPGQLEFGLERPLPGKMRPRSRARFELDGQDYDLALTDYMVEPRLAKAGFGSYGLADLGLSPDSDVLLTVSLAEPREDWCTKLVAAVLLLPKEG